MLNNILPYAGSLIVAVWGIGHIVLTKSVVALFGPLSDENRRILTMEWVGEGLTLCFLGVLVALVTFFGGADAPISRLVYWAAASMALVLGGWTFIIGSKTSIVPIKLCPLVLSVVAILYIVSAL